ESSGGPGRTRAARERGELAVRDDLAPRHGAKRTLAVAVEAVVELELHIREVVGLAGEERLQPCGQTVSKRHIVTWRGDRQLGVEHSPAVEPELTHAPPRRLVPNQPRAHRPML